MNLDGLMLGTSIFPVYFGNMNPFTKSLLPVIIICLFSINTFGQQDLAIQWQHIIGSPSDESARNLGTAKPLNVIAQCSDEGYVMLSTQPYNFNSPCDRKDTGQRLWLIKFNKHGVYQWEHCYGGYSFYSTVIPTSVIQTSDGGFALTGSTNYTDGDFPGVYDPSLQGDYDAFVIKTDTVGNVQWSKTYGGSKFDSFNCIVEDTPGYFIVAGATASFDGDITGKFTNEDDDGWIVKLATSGQIIWQKTIGTGLMVDDFFRIIKKTSDGSFITLGNICAKISSTGSIVWQNVEDGTDFSIDSKDNIYIAYTNWLTPQSSSIVRKLNPSGDLLWEKRLFSAIWDASRATGIHCINDATIAILGKTQDPIHIVSGLHVGKGLGIYEDVYLAIMDSSGKISTTRCFGGTDQELPTAFIPTKDNGFLVLANSKSSNGDILKNNGNFDWWLFKVGSYNTIKGRVFYDYNDNGKKDAGEDFFENVLVTSDKNGSFNGSFISDGIFKYTVDTGTYITKPLIQKPYFTVTPVSTYHDTYGHTDSMDFAVVPVPGIKDLAVSLSVQGPQRPGFKNKLFLVCSNQGTEVVQQAEACLFIDKRVNISSHDSTGFFRNGDTICWKMSNLEPREFRTIEINITNAAPPILNVEDSLFHYIEIKPFSNDSTDNDNVDTIRQNVVGSFDPNNKLDDVGGVMYYDKYKKGDYIFYTINFQNTGTDTAFTVIVRDTLSAKLDFESLEMITSSHPFLMTINKGNHLQWKFDNIDLPDSNRNEKRSHGYVIYKIKPKAVLSIGDTILNSASIYFDYNLPVQTNTNKTELKQRPFPKPAIAGLQNVYCGSAGPVKGKILNLPAGIAVLVKLDNSPIAVATDGTFDFDVSSLSAGDHIIAVEFFQNNDSSSATWRLSIIQPGILNIDLSADKTTITSPNEQVTITAVNATGGTNFTYGFAKDRNFTDILQQDGSNNFITISGTSLDNGSNWIYARIKANGQCYSEAFNVDSIQIILNTVTGIVDVDAPGQLIKIYPIPFNEYLLVKGLIPGKKYEFSLINNYGQEIYFVSVSNTNSIQITIPGLASGVYYLNVIKNKKKLGTAKVIKL